ncbi:MAG: serine/threonine protein kinase [Thermoleophilaceae bacterium]|nr:serine/threonine protein kinase [Thermoleophilaceae bacterium]
MELTRGAVIGPYTVEALLGVGGMGRVYQAVDPHGERVALKVVKRELAQDRIFRRRFDREADIAVRVKHPHVVPVLDKGEHDGIPYLAQSFIRGGSLADKLERDGSLDVEYAVRICLWVAAGLDAVHAAGLVHRDVKPGNILLDEQGVAHITDFGLAKDSQASILTRPGQALGSLDYMAPEQIRGEEVSAASDVYALGCVMIECLCSTPPFGDRKGMQVLWAHLRDEPPDLRASRPDLSPELSATIRMALEKEPAKRPATATAYARLVQISAGLARGPQGLSGAE